MTERATLLPIPQTEPPASTVFERIDAASAFKAMVLPHLLFVQEFSARQHFVDVCGRAWNIGLLTRAEQRTREIVRVSEAGAASRDGRVLDHELAMLQALVEQRRQMFPLLRAVVVEANLFEAPGHDELSVVTSGGNGQFEFVIHPTLDHLEQLGNELRQLHQELATLPSLCARIQQDGVALPDIWATRAICRCRLALLEISAYRMAFQVIGLHPLQGKEAARLVECLQDIEEIQDWVLAFLRTTGHEA